MNIPLISIAFRRLAIASLYTIYLVMNGGCAAYSMKFKAVYVDLDGTALDSLQMVRPATIAALNEFRVRGGHVGIATGRTLEQARNAINALRPDLPVVLYNGAVLAQPQSNSLEVLSYLDSTSFEVARNLLLASSSVIGVIAHSTDNALIIRDSQQLRRFAEKHGISVSLEDLRGLRPIKLIALITSISAANTLQIEMRNQLGTKARVVNSTGTLLEVLPANINKLEAIKRGIQGSSVSLKDILAFGDGENDAEMLAGVGFGAAMCGCLPPTCAAADVILGSSSSDAIGKFLYSFVLQDSVTQ